MAKRQVFSALNMGRTHGEPLKFGIWAKSVTHQLFRTMIGKK